MTDFFKMDVFFVTTTCAVVLVTIILIVVLIRVLRILKNVEHISENVEEESKLLREDIAEIRRNMQSGGLGIIKTLFSFGAKKRRRRASKDT